MNITRCNCGALTVEINGENYSMSAKSFDKTFPDFFSGDYKAIYHSCDYCVNHWGTDLCGCGCGGEVWRMSREYRGK